MQVHKGWEQPIIEIENFSFSYEEIDKQPLLDGLDVTLNPNEVTLLMGASGSGKSSLALCLNGLYPEAVEGISSGDIFFLGKHIQDCERGELTQKIGIVFQDPESQFCMITVEDELAFTLENRKIPASEIFGKIESVLKAVGMQRFIHHKIHELSGGQKQKIALASVLLLEPELLILDEPTANLDPVSSLEFIELVEAIQEERQMSCLIIEHQAEDWLRLIERVLVIGMDGKLLADDAPDRLFSEQQRLLEQEGIFLPEEYSGGFEGRKRYNQTVPAEKTVLSVRDLSFSCKNQNVLNNINIDVLAGELIAVAGENGAGKSTLLQLMAGLLEPDAGDIFLFDRPLKKWRENKLRKHMGFVFQNPEHQFITDTVYEELTFGMKCNGYTEAEMENAADLWMGQFGLREHRDNNPFALSGGQKRRLSVATVLDVSPDILLFDEPTYGQDAATTTELMDYVMELKAMGTAIIFVTHDMNIVDAADRAIILKQGGVAFSGVPDTLWKKTKMLYEARLRKPARLRQNRRESHVYDIIH
ncbi:putative HMP/thiamine import ATP-binding protein YkoD [Lentibacillus kapialis]|uniref:HMP/thiamine import ATP-binding protein YkoD n=1 Tax=Lentibacillus kapialis TaxID=340214 RepID=A0A917Q2E3_9BACI|nr:ABC transporter ATP-binding protein [Lentibacillus kapialis]GGK07925.1 putative HMP/thiamine import ATP-binding protein YkoD [Lentibacillus kapialis]